MKSLVGIFIISWSLFLLGCGGKGDVGGETNVFEPIDTHFVGTNLFIPKGGFESRILFQEGDLIFQPGGETALAPAKGKHDFLAYIPTLGSSDHGVLWVNHETATLDPLLGDGGGGTILEVFRDSVEGWKVIGSPHAIDFRPVGGTMKNCLGALTPWGTILTSEEVEPSRNLDFYKDILHPVISDTSEIDSLPRWANYGWMVEVDVEEKQATRKLYAMGRFMHEGNYCLEDRKTVYMMDDEAPGVFFKFVADKPGDYGEGQLYAFKMREQSSRGDWLALPRERDSLIYAREMALSRGATIFIRMEDVELGNDGMFYISETGKDSIDLRAGIELGGKPAAWLDRFHVGDSIFHDPYGRILKFDPKTSTLSVLLEGGKAAEDESIHLANPDNLGMDRLRNMLIIHEDINGNTEGRNPDTTTWINEIYTLDLSKGEPKLDDLSRLVAAPSGAETTGGTWNPNYSAYFFNIQHPDTSNPPPYNRSTTVVLSGWPEADRDME